MNLAVDYIHPTPHGGRCRVRIFLPEEERDSPVVICSELLNNPGQSVTNAAEQIAAEVISYYRLQTPLVWIEHYEDGARGTPEDPHTFDLVIFSGYGITKRACSLSKGRVLLGHPTWKPLDRQSVETLVGEPI
jgi:hypothetical protein